jgi:hypothetical protein
LFLPVTSCTLSLGRAPRKRVAKSQYLHLFGRQKLYRMPLVDHESRSRVLRSASTRLSGGSQAHRCESCMEIVDSARSLGLSEPTSITPAR